MTEIKIGNRLVGPTHTPFIIAEMSGNHGQSLDKAMALVDAAAAAATTGMEGDRRSSTPSYSYLTVFIDAANTLQSAKRDETNCICLCCLCLRILIKLIHSCSLYSTIDCINILSSG